MPTRPTLIVAILAVLTVVASACGKSDEATEQAATGEKASAREATTPAAPAQHPETEEALVEAVAAAIEKRDLKALQAVCAPEQSADLRQVHDEDPGTFWRRGQRWVINVQSGFDIGQRTEGSDKRWKALVKFGNDETETVIFAKHQGKLVFEQL